MYDKSTLPDSVNDNVRHAQLHRKEHGMLDLQRRIGFLTGIDTSLVPIVSNVAGNKRVQCGAPSPLRSQFDQTREIYNRRIAFLLWVLLRRPPCLFMSKYTVAPRSNTTHAHLSQSLQCLARKGAC